MKLANYYIICLLLAGPVLTSCNKWLDVSPKTSVKEDDQFSSKQGFVDALFGVYQNAASNAGYGQHLSYGLLDVLAQRYENKSNATTSFYGQAARYNYTSTVSNSFNTRGATDQIWGNMYKSISLANFILQNTDKHREALPGVAYNIVQGEALALRAMLHFDLVRLFAPAYLDGSKATDPAIPYMDKFTVQPQARLSLEGVLNRCEAELKQAEQLLAAYPDIDQIATNQNSTSSDLFLMFRQNHLNYWAVKALLARLYLYKNDKPMAYKYAKEVIDSQKFKFISQQELNVDPAAVLSDMTFSSEHIFSVYVAGLKADVDNYLKSFLITGGEAQDFFTTKAMLDKVYETTIPGYSSDLRSLGASKSLWNQVTATAIYSRKYYTESTANVKQRLIPVIRLPEMYYIAAEAAPTTQEGTLFLNTVRTARLLPELPAQTTAAALDAELLKEYRKEFYGEGQLWFYYKRKNTVTIPDGVGNPMAPAKYVFPFPLNEIEFGQ